MKWFFKYYEISQKEIVCNEGILFQKRRSYSLEKAESVSLNQSFLGKMFNFGTVIVELYMASSRYEVRLLRISNPRKYVSIIEQTLSQFGSSNGEVRDD
ncbi:PH domain-containing protein [Candidatus Gracilibacteria bacterium]|nr:PH domain-containing protein [Candidatus Gracilibacteria bacterium]